MTVYRILYRGSLSSCNYNCTYCPFAKTANTHQELQQDAREVGRFVDWAEKAGRPLAILFTPWGEAMARSHYRKALVRLSNMPHVQRVTMQTNLTGKLADLAPADPETLALWTTYHPTQVSLNRFAERCKILQKMHVRFSVGAVGLREHFDAILQLRRLLDPTIYLWVNSYKHEPNYYNEGDVAFLRQIDPYFDLNRFDYPSRGKACRAGDQVFSVDAHGDVRPCHFIDRPLANIYRDDVFAQLGPQACTNPTCGCHIGYVHRPELDLYRLFGENVLERIPADWPAVNPAFTAASALKFA